MQGFTLINKGEGVSSFFAVKKVKQISQQKKVGHAGTLDPFASGLLIIAMGRAYTRLISTFQALPKFYKTTMILGKTTPTLDPESAFTEETEVAPPLSKENIETVLASFEGEQYQMPPHFSAKKVNGQRAYTLARQGKPVTLEPVLVTIHAITLDAYCEGPFPEISFTCHCSKGTYIRSLVRDIGKALGHPAYTLSLTRTAIGPYTIENSVPLDDLTETSLSENVFLL